MITFIPGAFAMGLVPRVLASIRRFAEVGRPQAWRTWGTEEPQTQYHFVQEAESLKQATLSIKVQ
jgi:hypothetical protein